MSLVNSSFRRTVAAGRFILTRLNDGIVEKPCHLIAKPIRQKQTTQYQHRFSSSNPGSDMHRPTDFEKRILVYNKAYPSVAEVPNEVTKSQILRAKDWFRIRVNILMGVATVFASIGLIFSGKKAAREGRNVTQQNMEMHRQYQEKMAAARKES